MSESILYQLRFSHFNEKGRWALDYKGVPHTRVSLTPGTHPIRSRLLGGAGTLPLLVTEDGTFGDSAEIVAELERTHPDPPLYPADAKERERALELEQWLGKELGPQIRSAVFADLLPHSATAKDVLYQGLSPANRAAQRAMFPLTRIGARRTLPAHRRAGDRGREKTVEAMDRIEAELGSSGYLFGDAFSVADLTAAALLFPLIGPEQFQYELPDPVPPEWEQFRSEHRGRPAWNYVEEMYARHRGVSAERVE